MTTQIWQTALKNAVTTPKELLELLQLDMQLLNSAEAATKLFPLIVPRGYLARMQKGDLNDPLLRQVLPLEAELQETLGYHRDPLEEKNFNPVPGLLHKYYGRVLFTLVGTCAINCRFCFRRHFPYAENNPGTAGWDKAIAYIAEDPTITEVILSGGDPLVASDATLTHLTEKLATIPHLKRLRIHTRIPIVLPERITPEFIHWITGVKLKVVLATHCNHPQEINQEVRDATRALRDAGVVLLNQTVLLKGVNDNVETLVTLSEALFAAGIQPYYLHTHDKVQNTAHFDLPLETAQQLHKQMAQRLSGYLVPKLVCEQAGAPAKISLETREFYTD